jgi:hypothetical protein
MLIGFIGAEMLQKTAIRTSLVLSLYISSDLKVFVPNFSVLWRTLVWLIEENFSGQTADFAVRLTLTVKTESEVL